MAARRYAILLNLKFLFEHSDTPIHTDWLDIGRSGEQNPCSNGKYGLGHERALVSACLRSLVSEGTTPLNTTERGGECQIGARSQMQAKYSESARERFGG